MFIIEWIEIMFAVVGLCAAFIWVVRSGWHPVGKIIGALFAGSLLLMLLKMLSSGISTREQATVVLMFGLGGLVILAGLAVRRWNTGWHPWAIGGAALIVSALMIWTWSSTSRSGTAPPLVPSPMGGGSPAPVAVSTGSTPASVPSPSVRSRRSRASSSAPDLSDCDKLSFESKRALECP